MLVIIDYGIGNIGSIQNMLKKIGVQGVFSGDKQVIEKATKLILPGVGAFDKGMTCLNNSGLIPLLNQKVLDEKVPCMGICLGMQLMTKRSDEGQLDGLGWFDAETRKFELDRGYKIPHMGWNYADPVKNTPVTAGLAEDSRYYFVHSYYVSCNQKQDEMLKTNYGGLDFTSGISRDNIYGVQFHPEKSHKYGMALLKNFVYNV
ncbi:MAG: imidazole glycerol phosphate synthase subunit HisH [Flavobacteriales bacterium]|nr:imidazole glycerol phosphate synthase subunit HisH [Flavobacteriales bacterium]